MLFFLFFLLEVLFKNRGISPTYLEICLNSEKNGKIIK